VDHPTSLETNSPHVTAAMHGDGLMSLQFRRTKGAITEEGTSRDSLPGADAVIQLERRDGAYLMSVARFGDTLVTRELTDVRFRIRCTSGSSRARTTIPYWSVALSVTSASLFRQGRAWSLIAEYLGSNLEILDVATGNATIAHQYADRSRRPTGPTMARPSSTPRRDAFTGLISHLAHPRRSIPALRRATTTIMSSRSTVG